MDWVPFNFAIMKNPMNWVIVVAMLLIVVLTIDLGRRVFLPNLLTDKKDSN